MILCVQVNSKSLYLIWAICIVLPFSTKKTGLLEQNAMEFNSSWKGSCICVYLYCLVSFCNVEFFTSASCSLLELNSFIDPGGLGFRSRFGGLICCLLVIWVHVPFTYPLHALSSTDFFPLRQCYIWWKHMWACCCVYTVEKYPQLYIFLKTEIVREEKDDVEDRKDIWKMYADRMKDRKGWGEDVWRR